MLLLLTAATTMVNAADQDVKVMFKPGTSAAHLENRVKGYDVVRYDLDARAGQTMTVDFYGTENTCDFVVHAPDGTTIFDELHESRKFKHTLEETGTYRIIAGMMRVSARRGKTCAFSMDIGIED
jgi:hypothetical protein